MLGDYFQILIARSTAFAERHFSGRHSAAKIAALWFVAAAFIAYPDWDLAIRAGFLPGRGNLVWTTILQQSAHPFAITHYPPSSHESKMALRLLPPLIGHVLGFGVIGFFLFQVASYFGFCYLATRLMLRASGDVAVTCFAALACAASGIGTILSLDTSPMFDAVAFVFMALAMLSSSPAVIIACFVLAGFTDERAMVAIPMIFLFHSMRGGTLYPNTVHQLVRANASAWAAILAIPVYLALRVAVEQATGLSTPGEDNIKYLLENFNEWALALWSVFEAGWFVVLGGMAVLALRRAYLLLTLSMLAIFPSILTSFMVVDMTRSLAFLFPIFVLMTGVICTNERRPHALFFYAMLASLLFPNYVISGTQRARFVVPTVIAPITWIPILLRSR